jgi:hypothetical protein
LALRYFTVCLIGSALLTGCPSATDHDDATKVLGFVRDKYPFPAQNQPKTGPTIYFDPSPWSTTLKIYRIRNAQDQEKIIGLVREARSATSGKPVHIVFIDEERFTELGNGRSRSGETVLRKVTVND